MYILCRIVVCLLFVYAATLSRSSMCTSSIPTHTNIQSIQIVHRVGLYTISSLHPQTFGL